MKRARTIGPTRTTPSSTSSPVTQPVKQAVFSKVSSTLPEAALPRVSRDVHQPLRTRRVVATPSQADASVRRTIRPTPSAVPQKATSDHNFRGKAKSDVGGRGTKRTVGSANISCALTKLVLKLKKRRLATVEDGESLPVLPIVLLHRQRLMTKKKAPVSKKPSPLRPASFWQPISPPSPLGSPFGTPEPGVRKRKRTTCTDESDEDNYGDDESTSNHRKKSRSSRYNSPTPSPRFDLASLPIRQLRFTTPPPLSNSNLEFPYSSLRGCTTT